MRVLLLTLLALQTATPPAFEVASVKGRADGTLGSQMSIPRVGRFRARNVSARALVGFAYPAYDQIGIPSWATRDRYDIEAQGTASASRSDTIDMLRNLLKERFGLRVHYEDQNKRVLALTVVKGSRKPALQAVAVDCAQADIGAQELPLTPTSPMKPCQMLNSGSIINSGGMTMEKFAQLLTSLMEQPVIDRTGLAGDYRFVFKFSRVGPSLPPPSDEYPDIPTALQEELGLTLDRVQGTLRILVIDHIERPTPN